MQLSKKENLGLFALTLFFWFFPAYESINKDARGAQDLSVTGQLLFYMGVAVFLFLMHPLFLWMWNWLKKWINGETL